MTDLKTIAEPDRLAAARRAFLTRSGLAAAGLAALGVSGTGTAEAAPVIDDVAIFNFALNLEYLEAEFYLAAAFGRGLRAADTTGPGAAGRVLGGRQVSFKTPFVREYAEEIADDEEKHVQFIRSVLGTAAVARPKIDIRGSFTAAAQAAGVIGPGQTFDPFADEDSFLLGAFIFEDVGVTAYKGAARLIANKDYLEAAAGILAVEAYHAGEIRTLIFGRGLSKPANLISDARGSLSGSPGGDQGPWMGGKANIVPADRNTGIAFSRTPRQVLNIVYLGGDMEGGFFPNGLNGTING